MGAQLYELRGLVGPVAVQRAVVGEQDLLFSWPNARTAVMGGEQAAMTMRMVAEAAARRAGAEPDAQALDTQHREIVQAFDSQSGGAQQARRAQLLEHLVGGEDLGRLPSASMPRGPGFASSQPTKESTA